MEGGDFIVKKAILPIVCAIILLFVLKTFNPDIAGAGIVLGLMMGLGLGALLNAIIFKKKDSDEAKELENN